MERKYTAHLDDGHDYSEICFYSKHRNGSKENIEDCKRQITLERGYARAKQLRIMNIEKI